MPELSLMLNEEAIAVVKENAVKLVKDMLEEDLLEMILYGSCARGDYTADSDVDIALIVKSSRKDAQRYNRGLAAIATELAIKYFAIVNFVCIASSLLIRI